LHLSARSRAGLVPLMGRRVRLLRLPILLLSSLHGLALGPMPLLQCFHLLLMPLPYLLLRVRVVRLSLLLLMFRLELSAFGGMTRLDFGNLFRMSLGQRRRAGGTFLRNGRIVGAW
jgi:hypothetical protein